MTEDRTNESDSSFIRGYATAVAEFARWNGQINPSYLLASAGITRELALRSDVTDHDMEALDGKGAWSNERF